MKSDMSIYLDARAPSEEPNCNFPERISLDYLEIGSRFNIVGASLRGASRSLVNRGIFNNTDLIIISRDRHSILMKADRGPQWERVRRTHAKHLMVRYAF